MTYKCTTSGKLWIVKQARSDARHNCLVNFHDPKRRPDWTLWQALAFPFLSWKTIFHQTSAGSKLLWVLVSSHSPGHWLKVAGSIIPHIFKFYKAGTLHFLTVSLQETWGTLSILILFSPSIHSFGQATQGLNISLCKQLGYSFVQFYW